MLKNLLFYRLIIFNTLGFVALSVAYFLGYIDILMHHDPYGVSYSIAALLGVGIFGTLTRGWKISQSINLIKGGFNIDRSSARKMVHKNKYIGAMAGWAVLIGLFGNALGLALALTDIDTALQAAALAFGSTVAGILTALWLEVNFTMLDTATGILLEDVEDNR